MRIARKQAFRAGSPLARGFALVHHVAATLAATFRRNVGIIDHAIGHTTLLCRMPQRRAKRRIVAAVSRNGRSAQGPAPATAMLRNARQASRAGPQQRAVLLYGCAMARRMAWYAINISMMGSRAGKSSAARWAA